MMKSHAFHPTPPPRPGARILSGNPLRNRFIARILLAVMAAALLPAAAASGLPAAAATASSLPAAAAAGSEDNAAVILPRTPAPSPDGSRVAFVHQGDIWVVSAEGGMAHRLTSSPGYDSHPVWSPNGRWIAFASDRDGNDDIYVLPLDGGGIRRLTWHSDGDTPTGWTPDSRHVLFNSRRHVSDPGAAGLFLVSIDGGDPRPLMATSGQDGVLSHDGARLAYTRGSRSWSRRGYEGSGRSRLWLFEADPPFGDDPASRVPVPRDRGPAPLTNPGVHSAAALRPDGVYRNLTEFGSTGSAEGAGRFDPQVEIGRNAVPQWFPDGRLMYVSERDGMPNLKLLSPHDGVRRFLTRLTEGWMRRPALSRDGSLAVFEYDDGIYTLRLPVPLPPMDSDDLDALPEPVRLGIRIPGDQASPQFERVSISGDAGEIAVSPDGKQYAFAVHGEIFCARVHKDDTHANRLTDHPARDWQVTWAKDSAAMVFVSDREGARDLWMVRSADPDEERLSRTMRLETIRLTDDPLEDHSPQFSPDGATIAFLRGRGRLMLMDSDGSNQRLLVDGWTGMEFSWSPDSRWIAYATDDFDYNTDIWIVSADGRTVPVNITRHPATDQRPRWSPDGSLLAFISHRRYLNQADVWYVRLTREDDERSLLDRLDAFDDPADSGGARRGSSVSSDSRGGQGRASGSAGSTGRSGSTGEEAAPEVPDVRIDFEDIHLRVRRLTGLPGRDTDVLVSPDSRRFFFVSDTDGNADLWRIDWDGSNLTRLTEGGTAPQDLQWGPKGERIYFRTKGGNAASIGTDGGKVETYSFNTGIRIDRPAERLYTFEEAWRLMRDHFYDPEMHGTDWDAARERYRPWAMGASTRRDFHDVIRMMLGELNSSHLGIWGGPSDAPAGLIPSDTGEIGAVFDAAYTGPGLRISRVVPGTAADREESRLAAGDILLAVNGEAVGGDQNLARLLDRTADQRVLLTVRGANGREKSVVLRPNPGREFRDRLAREEVLAMQLHVEKMSNGRLGYIQIEGMNIGSLEDFERDLYAVAHGKDGLLIDVRNNGGGWTTDLLLTSLNFPDHATTVGRDGGPGYPSARRLLYAWTKPVVVLCNENSFSNAEIFSWAIKTTGRGPLVGRETFGGVISTGGTTLLDGSWLRLPGRGWFSHHDGSNMERQGCPPDIDIENLPGDVARGIDTQLEVAIEEGLKLLD